MTKEISNDDSVIIDNKLIKISDLSDDLKQLLIEKLSSPSSDGYVKPDLDQIYNIKEFEPIAKKILSKETYAYYRTGAADEITLLENELAFQRIYLRPRILNSVSKVNLKTTILGSKTDVPFYITAFAGSNLDNFTEGEKPLASAAGKQNVIQMIPSMTTFPLQTLVDSFNNSEIDQWLQIYVRSSIDSAIELIREAEKTGKITSLFFTVDVAQLGRRETDSRAKKDSKFVKKVENITADLNWDDLKAIQKETNLKIVLKGIQSVEDAIKAAEYGFDGIVLSNHGGRQLDTARSSIEVLAEVVPELKRRNLYHKIEILIDSGVRRGSDIVKAIALGAKGVGLGRPFLYSLHSYGEDGVTKVLDILREEVELTLRLLGVTDINNLDETYVDTLDLFKNRAVSI